MFDHRDLLCKCWSIYIIEYYTVLKNNMVELYVLIGKDVYSIRLHNCIYSNAIPFL